MVQLECCACGQAFSPAGGNTRKVNCGAVNEVPTSAVVCNCLASRFQSWALTVGKHADSVGDGWYNPDQATSLIRPQYIEQLGIDPETALEAMRRLGKKGVAGFHNCSTPGSKKAGVK